MMDRASVDRQQHQGANIGPMSLRCRVFLGFGCGVAMLSLLLRFGLCLPEFRFLSDKDYFKGAVDRVIHDPFDKVIESGPAGVIFKSVHSQRYASAEAFLDEFPNCCRFVTEGYDDGPEISLWDWLLGDRLIEVAYEKRYTEAGDQKFARAGAKMQ